MKRVEQLSSYAVIIRGGSLKLYYTKEELVQEWLDIHPSYEGREDIEDYALGGYVRLENGLYIWYSYWETIKKGDKNARQES